MGRGEFRVSVDISSSGSGGSLVGGGTGVTKGKERLSFRWENEGGCVDRDEFIMMESRNG